MIWFLIEKEAAAGVYIHTILNLNISPYIYKVNRIYNETQLRIMDNQRSMQSKKEIYIDTEIYGSLHTNISLTLLKVKLMNYVLMIDKEKTKDKKVGPLI